MTTTTLPAAVMEIRAAIEAKGPDLQVMLGNDRARAFMREIFLCVERRPDLWNANQKGLVMAVMDAAVLRLPCTGGSGTLAHLVPFKNSKTGKDDIVLIPDYKGLIDIAYRSGKIATIEAHPVYARDRFSETLGVNKNLIHEPSHEADRGDLVGAYAMAFLPGAAKPVWAYLTVEQIEKSHRPAKTRREGSMNPWITHYPDMCRKTAVRVLYKDLPKTEEMVRAMELDDSISDLAEARAAKPTAADLDPKEKGEATPKRTKKAASDGTEGAPPAEENPADKPKTGKIVRSPTSISHFVVMEVCEGKNRAGKAMFTIKVDDRDDQITEVVTMKGEVAAAAMALLHKEAVAEVQACDLDGRTWVDLLVIEAPEPARSPGDVPF